MTYTGNTSLSPDVRRRILSTFRQTLDLAAQGSHHEATLGCDFVLQMDPQFGPARALQERLNRSRGEPVEVDDLRVGVAALEEAAEAATAGERAAGGPAAGVDEIFGELDDLDLEGGDAAAPVTDPAVLRDRLAERIEVRDFAGALELARRAPRAVAADPELARLVETASARQEAAPYVQKFLDAARRSTGEGDHRGAATMLEKARSLDPTHPGVRDLAARLSAPGAASPPKPPAERARAFAEPADSESAGRIAELLAVGQKSFDGGDYQSAIDSWSRIFLIDIDHAEASRRIEEARRLKAEQERRVEEVFHEATDQLGGGDRAAARRGFEKVIELEPGHLAAREYLDRLSREESSPSPAAAPAAPARPAAAHPPRSERPVLKEEILVPPPPGTVARPEVDPAKVAAVKESGARRRFAVIGGAVLVVVAAVLFLLYQNRDSLFPNSNEVTVPTPETVDPIARATGLHDSGKTAMALNQLRKLPPTDPHYEQAQALISQWEASGRATEAAAATGPSAEDLDRRQELMATAIDALSRHRYLTAAESLDKAAAIAPLDESDAALRRQAEAALAPIAHEIEMFRDGEYEMVLPSLWRLHQSEPDNLDVERLLVDGYYNLAVRDFQRGDAAAAASKLGEVAGLAPDDPVIARHRQFAVAYKDREKDLQYRIYVKYLPIR